MNIFRRKRKNGLRLPRKFRVYEARPGATEAQIAALTGRLGEAGFPVCELPAEYVDLLRRWNGGNFGVGEREYQLFSAQEVVPNYDLYEFATYMPYALPFAMDGNGWFYLFDLRRVDPAVYACQTGCLSWDEDDCFRVAPTLSECLEQPQPLDELWN